MGSLAFRRVAFFVVCAVVGIGWGLWSNVRSTSRQLWDLVHTSPDGMVDFSKLGSTDWERVYVVPPYTSAEEINTRLGFPWAAAARSSIHDNDSTNLVMFVQGKQVIDWFEFPRSVELGELTKPEGFSRTEARFRIERENDGRLRLKLP